LSAKIDLRQIFYNVCKNRLQTLGRFPPTEAPYRLSAYRPPTVPTYRRVYACVRAYVCVSAGAGARMSARVNILYIYYSINGGALVSAFKPSEIAPSLRRCAEIARRVREPFRALSREP
jgi:hypothetical protein